jgi:hypothetical protein
MQFIFDSSKRGMCTGVVRQVSPQPYWTGTLAGR